ncbi:MAG: thiol-activated cytolysin family protein [Myxococcota bacterium]
MRPSPLVLFLLVGCADDDPVSRYLTELPSWEEFAPRAPSEPPTPVGEPTTYVVEDSLTEFTEDEEGNVVTNIYEDVEYDCTQTEYTMTDTPQRFVSYSPDVELLYPGALVQGRSHRDGLALGSLLPLPIDDRTPIRVSIPAIPSGANFREVASPNQANVSSAIGQMVGDATLADLSTPSTIDFEQARYHDQTEFALSLGVSGRYFGLRASASTDITQERASTTVTAHFFQKMFEVVVEPPSTPGGFFAETFTADKLAEQEALGRIGHDNLPIYVSNIVYGRMLTYSVTSTASEDEIVGALDATFRKLGQGASVEVDVRHQQVLESSEIEVQSLGGDASNVLELIRSGDLRAYFDTDAPLSSAAPLSYTFRNLGDGSIAAVSETTTYQVTECIGEAPAPPPEIPIDPDERVAWLDRILLVDDSCESQGNGDAEIGLYFSGVQDSVATEIVDTRSSPVLMNDSIGSNRYDFPDRQLFEIADADGQSNPVRFVGDAWEFSNFSTREFLPSTPGQSAWEIAYGAGSAIGERCFTRHTGDGCSLRLFVCIVNGRADAYDEDDCVAIDPGACT